MAKRRWFTVLFWVVGGMLIFSFPYAHGEMKIELRDGRIINEQVNK